MWYLGVGLLVIGGVFLGYVAGKALGQVYIFFLMGRDFGGLIIWFLSLTFRIFFGRDSFVHLYKEYWVRALPSYYLIDRRGRLLWGPEHKLPDSTLIEKLLNE